MGGGLALTALSACGGARELAECVDPTPSALQQNRAAPGEVRLGGPVEALEQSERFELGVASGDATPRSVTAWTHHRGPQRLALHVWEHDGERRGTLAVQPAQGGFTHARVGGLSPGRRYRFAFVEVDERGWARARSPIGRFRTAIAPGAMEPLTVGALSCVSYTRPHDTLAAAADLDLDLLLALGDSSYNDGARSLCEYRQAWGQTLSTAGWRALRGRTSQLVTWDDHEVANDFAGPNVDAEQLTNARQALFEHQPIRRLPRHPDRIWRSARWGRTAEIFVLDCRSERDPFSRGPESGAMLSQEQARWLERGLAGSDAVFKLIMTSVPISEYPNLGMFPKRHDRWEPYEAQRRELLSFVDEQRLSGVLWVGGDLHIGAAGRVGARPWRPGGQQLEVLAGPGAQRINDVSAYLRAPQFDLALPQENVTTFDLEPDQVRVRVRFWGAEGRALADLTYDLHHGVRLVRRG